MKTNKSSISEGYRHYSVDDTLKNHSSSKLKITDYRYPKGYLPVISILIVEIVILLVGFLVSSKTQYEGENGPVTVELLRWYEVVLIAFVVGFCLQLVWLILRQRFGLQSKYNLSKWKDQLTLKTYRDKKNLVNYDLAANNIKSYEEYVAFCEKRHLTSRLIFWISFGIQGLLMLTFIIVNVVYATT